MSSALELASDLSKQSGKPAYIEFSTIAKHLPKRSEEEGRYVAVDVDMVTVRQIGAADSCVFEVKTWLSQLKQDVQADRLPREHADYYAKAYQHWKAGQEIPLEGTPIKGWPVISPAQTALLVSIGIRTVEDLSAINDEARVRIGMGAIMLKNKAQAWLSQAQDKGPLTIQMAHVQAENEVLKLNLAKLTEQVEALQEARKAEASQSTRPMDLSAEDLLGEEPKPRRAGRPRKEA